MLFDYISIVWGMIKIVIYKVFYLRRVFFKSIPKLNSNFCFALRKGTKTIFGKRFKARDNLSIRNEYNGILKIGDNCFFNNNVSVNCQMKIDIGNNVYVGQNVVIIDHDHDYKKNINEFIKDEIKIGNNVWIGANSIILRGSCIPDNSVVAANTIVTKKSSYSLKQGCLIYNRRDIVIKEDK